jgi:hypothetical protein
MSSNFKWPVYSARALNKERLANTTTSDRNRKNKDGAMDLPWVWLSQIILAVADRFRKMTRRSVYLAKFLSPRCTWLNSSAQATPSGLFCRKGG